MAFFIKKGGIKMLSLLNKNCKGILGLSKDYIIETG